ncbi:hypothetical protein DM02DRAFT_408392 [Periconia macrospinosa]|uniref:Uncharacterized protein n=1 Tax=Periconia macrospinosa TaxID=97972 RepID=A0A2V1E8V3_9PLEO|nr:hypothetical protein DM02DRAFT_408392 [Periconia macrospinosa]
MTSRQEAMGARKQAGLGESWDEAYISSSENTPMNSTSSQSDDDVATPLPPRLEKSTLRTRRTHGSTPNRSSPTATRRSSAEPNFIMPSMGDDFNRARRPSRRASGQSMYREPSQEQNRATRRRTPRHVRREDRDESSHQDGYAQVFWTRLLQPLLSWIVNYTAGVIGSALEFLMPVFGILLCVVVIMYAMQYSTNALVNNALARICYLPGSSYVLPFCGNTSNSTKQGIPSPNFKELGEIQSIFADVMEANKDSYYVPRHLSKGRIAMINFKLTVKHSHLPSSAELTHELDTFIRAMDQTIDDLLDYNSNVGSTVDRVIHANKHALQNLATLTETEAQQALAASQNSLSNLLSYLNPWALTRQAAQDSLERHLFLQYTEHLAALSSKIDALTQSALRIKFRLKEMDKLTTAISEIGIQDHKTVATRHADIKSSLWFGIIGKDRRKLKDFDKMLEIIDELFAHRDVAAEAVSITIEKLGIVNADLTRLKEDVEAPRIALEAGDDKWEGDGKVKGIGARKPLKYHIELVQQTTDRMMELRNANHRFAENAMMAGSDDGKRQKSLPGRVRDRFPMGV